MFVFLPPQCRDPGETEARQRPWSSKNSNQPTTAHRRGEAPSSDQDHHTRAIRASCSIKALKHWAQVCKCTVLGFGLVVVSGARLFCGGGATVSYRESLRSYCLQKPCSRYRPGAETSYRRSSVSGPGRRLPPTCTTAQLPSTWGNTSPMRPGLASFVGEREKKLETLLQKRPSISRAQNGLGPVA